MWVVVVCPLSWYKVFLLGICLNIIKDYKRFYAIFFKNNEMIRKKKMLNKPKNINKPLKKYLNEDLIMYISILVKDLCKKIKTFAV